MAEGGEAGILCCGSGRRGHPVGWWLRINGSIGWLLEGGRCCTLKVLWVPVEFFFFAEFGVGGNWI